MPMMEYNTYRLTLVQPEYGRHVQQMVDYLLTIPDRDARTQQALEVIRVMMLIQPQRQRSEEYEHSLWDHLHQMAHYQLDVDSPYPVPTPEEANSSLEPLPYPPRHVRPSHYGKIARDMVQRLSEEPRSPERTELLRMLANQMKRNAAAWGRGPITDAEVLRDVQRLSQGRLSLEGVALLDEDVNPSAEKGGKPGNGKKRKKKKKN
jgi:hypothetical protein